MPSLLQRIAANDRSAVREVIDEYGGLVWRLARRYLDRADQQAEDAVQDVFVEIWLSAARFDPTKGSEAAFIATIAHRRLTDAQRRVGSRAKLTAAAREREYAKIDDLPHPSHGLVRRQERNWVGAMMNELPEEERQTLWLYVHSGMTHGQIAEATGNPIGTVKSRLRRAVMRLTEAAARQPDAAEGVKP